MIVLEGDRKENDVVTNFFFHSVASVLKPTERVEILLIASTEVGDIDELVVDARRRFEASPPWLLGVKVEHNHFSNDVLADVLSTVHHEVALVEAGRVVPARPDVRAVGLEHLPLVALDVKQTDVAVVASVLELDLELGDPAEQDQFLGGGVEAVPVPGGWLVGGARLKLAPLSLVQVEFIKIVFEAVFKGVVA